MQHQGRIGIGSGTGTMVCSPPLSIVEDGLYISLNTRGPYQHSNLSRTQLYLASAFPLRYQLYYAATKYTEQANVLAEANLRTFGWDTENFVKMIIEALRGDETLRRRAGIEG
jgi:hypothetical protein